MGLFFSELINQAAEFAAVSHRDQLRKSPEVDLPYLQHPYMVGLILQRAGFDDEVVAAGILHDVLEDTPAVSGDLEAAFGRRVAQLVLDVTENDKTLPWGTRKRKYLEQIRRAPTEARAIAAADKIHNISSIVISLGRGADIWSRLKADPETQIARFERTLEVLRDGWNHRLVDELADTLTLLKEAMGGGVPLSRLPG